MFLLCRMWWKRIKWIVKGPKGGSRVFEVASANIDAKMIKYRGCNGPYLLKSDKSDSANHGFIRIFHLL